ncbi:MAG: winged helix-turn-helix transcriptional regulator [Lachnospiraceae bacterium]|nr:winged helix-turn-helix transcriptional regulator [Lachnospiraceae bacterium]
MNISMEFAYKIVQAYSMRCKPLCQEIRMPQTAFDILMFLANNPQFHTARDIVEIRKIKANLVSVNVDKLVREGYLDRRESSEDRRKTLLECTEKAGPVIEKGHQLQAAFLGELFGNIDDESLAVFSRIMKMVGMNLDKMMERQEN